MYTIPHDSMSASAQTAHEPPLVSYTVFREVWPTTKTEHDDVAWAEFVASIRNAREYPSKAHCPLISMAEYGDLRSQKGCIRHAANVRRIFGVELDYDGEQMPIEEGAAILQRANICAVLYTSPSHTAQRPRWRVLLPLSEPATPEKRAEYVGRANRLLGGIASRESFTLSQSFYLGRVRGAEYVVIDTTGRCIDMAAEIEPLYYVGGANDGETRRDATTDEDLRAAFDRGEGRYQAMLKLSARWAARGMPQDDIEAALHGLLDKGDTKNGDGIDLRTRVTPIARSAVLKYGETRARQTDGVADVADVAGLAEPEPLRRPLPPAEPYPIDALGPVLAGAARRIHEVVQAPAALCGQSILAAASLAAQPHADVVVDGRREPLSLFLITIAESGERKSAADRVALQAHRDYERSQLDQYRDDMQMHEIALTAHEAAVRAASKGKDAGAIRAALEDVGPPPTAPLNPIFLVPTPTLEGIHKLYATGRPSLGLFHDDAGEFLGGHAMNSENRIKSAAGLSRLWDVGEFDRVRAGDGATKYFGRRLAMHLMIQPVIAESVLSDDVLTGQGLLARTLLAWPDSTIGHRPYVEVDLTADAALASYRRHISALLTREPVLRAGTVNELEPRALTLTADAKRVWIAVHDAIEADQKDGGMFASVRAWASKSPAQTLRIAGVLTLIEDPDAGVIHAEAIERAALLVQYHLAEAVRIVGTTSVPVEIRNAEALRDWCHRERITYLHSGSALQFGPASIRTAAAFNAAIEVLERTGWAIRIEGGHKIDGAMRRRAWLIRGRTP